MMTSHLDDGEFARLLYGKVEDLIGSLFTASSIVRWRPATPPGSAASRSICSGSRITRC